jgi:hypothetical protein
MKHEKHVGPASALGFGHLGNGMSVWDRTRNYVMVAHIGADRKIQYRGEGLSDEQIEAIEHFARTDDSSISATQTDQKVFTSRPI